MFNFNCCNIVFTDCQYFFLCLNGKDARRNGCQVNYSLRVTFKLKLFIILSSRHHFINISTTDRITFQSEDTVM